MLRRSDQSGTNTHRHKATINHPESSKKGTSHLSAGCRHHELRCSGILKTSDPQLVTTIKVEGSHVFIIFMSRINKYTHNFSLWSFFSSPALLQKDNIHILTTTYKGLVGRTWVISWNTTSTFTTNKLLKQ